ncbi:MAG: hypothetical protein GY930_13370 [bacterium]|nr:hypothetical protein [bacterium]
MTLAPDVSADGHAALRSTIEQRTAPVVGVDPGDGAVCTSLKGSSPMVRFPEPWCAEMAGHDALQLLTELPPEGLAPVPHVPGPLPVNAAALASNTSQLLSDASFHSSAAFILVTDHIASPYEQIAAEAPLIVDTCGNAMLCTAGPATIPPSRI